ncbi:MAG TPA: ABC transporter permease [Acidobacteriaceae bacterium]|nr:ABC transporter permease [Acidobacteriaceae bacterium]
MFSDLKLALRQLSNSPGFATTAVLMLAFAIGATTAIFSIVDGVLLRPLPFPNSDRLVTLGDQVSGTSLGSHGAGPVTGPEIIAYTRDTHSFTELGGYSHKTFELSGIGMPAHIDAARMTPGVFSALGVSPLIGRVFTAQEDRQDAPVAVLSYSTWRSRFNGNPRVLGSKILLDRRPYVVIGIMPRSFEFPLVPGQLERCELWVPMSFTPAELTGESQASWYLYMVGRLKPGITTSEAQSDAQHVALQTMHNFPPQFANFHIRAVVHPLRQITVQQARPLIRTLFFAVAVVLLIACANLAGLLLVRAIRRQREIAVRRALGASAAALLRQSIFESLLLSLAGGLIGIGLAAVTIMYGRGLLPATLPRISDISLNWTVAGFALVLAVSTGALCGLAPAFAALRTNVNASLKEGGRSGSAGGNHTRLRSMLVVMEIAVALTLLTASGLLLRSFQKMSKADLGFQPDHVTAAGYNLPRRQYSSQAQVDAFNKELLLKLRQLPAVKSVGLTSTLPTMGKSGLWSFVPEDYTDPRGPDQTYAAPVLIMGDYFRAIGMPLLRGRLFTEADNVDSRLVTIVNQEFAQHYWPNENPIGKRIRFGTHGQNTPWMSIIGVVADAKLSAPDSNAGEQFYFPLAQVEKDYGALGLPTDLNGNFGYIVLRSDLPPEQMENAVRATVRSIDPLLALTHLETMEQVVSASEAPRRFNTFMISAFALAALLLAVLGIYSVIAFSVASRVQEMAIRMALGSQQSGIVRLILMSGLRLALVGCILGLAGSLAASSLLRSMLFAVSPFDPLVMVIATCVVFALAIAASALPARRAASVDPMQALRSE